MLGFALSDWQGRWIEYAVYLYAVTERRDSRKQDGDSESGLGLLAVVHVDLVVRDAAALADVPWHAGGWVFRVAQIGKRLDVRGVCEENCAGGVDDEG